MPVVVPDIGGPADAVRDGVNGLVYRAGDADALAAALRRLRDDPRLRERLGARGPDSVGTFRPEVVAARTKGFYARVLAAGRGFR
jgi:glycosyltransferase involved in cell wall biosynthesis